MKKGDGKKCPPLNSVPPWLVSPSEEVKFSNVPGLYLRKYDILFHAPGDDGFFFHTSEDDVFGHIGDDSLPFTEIAMKDQDKNEDIMEALSIDVNKKPYFPYLGFYITLAIIKKNNFEASKVDEQFLF